MLRLRTILLCNWLYILLLIVVLIVSIIRINLVKESYYTEGNYKIYGIVKDYYIAGDKLEITIKSNEKLLLNYYFDTEKEKDSFNLKIGDYIFIKTELKLPNNNSNKNLFNYRKYLKRKNINYIGNIYNYKLIRKNKNIYYNFKQIIKDYIGKNPYLNTFILGDKKYLSKQIIKSYQDNGISHLFAISGMHISIFSTSILALLKKIRIKENYRYLITSIFLIIYLFIANISPSILRSVLFFIFFSINKIYYFYIKPINLAIVVLCICLLINPNFIFEISFLYSFIISISLIICSDYINRINNYFIKLFKVSLISFIVSFPITIYSYYSINVFSIIYNLLFVPLVSIIIFPLSLITFFLPITEPLFNILIWILENISLTLSKIKLELIFPRINIIFYLLYYLIFILMYKYRNKLTKIIMLIFLFCHYFLFIINDNLITFMDVGQGDSTLLFLSSKAILIDTGGKKNYDKGWKQKNRYSSISNDILIPSLKSYGIKRINFFVISHADYDHMGEAINLVENFKVEKVIFNCGEFNDLEKELIKVLDKKKIPYYSCIKELNIDNNKLYFLQTKEYDNENDNSNVIYTEINDYKFMFMGDAGIVKEKDILDKYNINNIDVLKVGHHGSKTSSNESFIDEIQPKYSVISVGKNNRYGHPNKEVLENLQYSKTYRTDQDGSIMFKIKNNKLQIETCSP